MVFRLSPLQNLTVLAVSGGLVLGVGCWSEDAIAHQVQTSTDIGGTVHIEPNDTPRAGDPAVAWFALTQRGGVTVPLAECDCKLTVYSGSGGGEPEAIATPSLTPLSIEGYENIPSATITFPAVGQYELVMSGAPTTEGAFQPFELRFPVTVATVAPAATPSFPLPELSTPTAVESPAPEKKAGLPRVAIALIPAIIIGLCLLLFVFRQAKSPLKDDNLDP